MTWEDRKTQKACLERYRAASAEIIAVFHEVAPEAIVEKASIDEAYLDVTSIVDAHLQAMLLDQTACKLLDNKLCGIHVGLRAQHSCFCVPVHQLASQPVPHMSIAMRASACPCIGQACTSACEPHTVSNSTVDKAPNLFQNSILHWISIITPGPPAGSRQ